MIDEPQSETPEVSANKLKVGWQLLKLTFADWWNDNTFHRAGPADCRRRDQFLPRARDGGKSDRK
jgi:hypothetical protein